MIMMTPRTGSCPKRRRRYFIFVSVSELQRDRFALIQDVQSIIFRIKQLSRYVDAGPFYLVKPKDVRNEQDSLLL